MARFGNSLLRFAKVHPHTMHTRHTHSLLEKHLAYIIRVNAPMITSTAILKLYDSKGALRMLGVSPRIPFYNAYLFRTVCVRCRGRQRYRKLETSHFHRAAYTRRDAFCTIRILHIRKNFSFACYSKFRPGSLLQGLSEAHLSCCFAYTVKHFYGEPE